MPYINYGGIKREISTRRRQSEEIDRWKMGGEGGESMLQGWYGWGAEGVNRIYEFTLFLSFPKK